MHTQFLKMTVCLAVVALVLGLAVPSTPAVAQDGPSDAEIEAQINDLARRIHINDLRDPGTVQWVHGNLGAADYLTARDPGYQFPLLVFEDFEGNPVRIKEPERPLLINMWASWCPPCVYEFPMLLDAAAEFEHIDLVLLNVSDDLDNAQDFLASQPIEGVPSYVDGDDLFLQMVGLVAYPTTVLIDTDGTLLITRTGTVSPTFLQFADLVGGYPDLGTFDPSTVSTEDLRAQLGELDLDTATATTIGSTETGVITHENWKALYVFEGKAGDVLTITMTRDNERGLFDPYLVLIGPSGERVAENDDGDARVRPNARITITLGESGTYVLVATRLLEADGLDEGGYTLRIEAEQ